MQVTDNTEWEYTVGCFLLLCCGFHLGCASHLLPQTPGSWLQASANSVLVLHTWTMQPLYLDHHSLNNHLRTDCIDILQETGLLCRPPHITTITTTQPQTLSHPSGSACTPHPIITTNGTCTYQISGQCN